MPRRRAFNEGTQINFRHDAVADQKFVGRMVDLEHVLTHALLNDVLHHDPNILRKRRLNPLLDKMLGQYFRTKDILLGELRQAFEVLNAQAQVVQLPTRKIQQAQRQARGKDAGFDRFVAHELELAQAQAQWFGRDRATC